MNKPRVYIYDNKFVMNKLSNLSIEYGTTVVTPKDKIYDRFLEKYLQHTIHSQYNTTKSSKVPQK